MPGMANCQQVCWLFRLTSANLPLSLSSNNWWQIYIITDPTVYLYKYVVDSILLANYNFYLVVPAFFVFYSYI